MNAQMLRRAEEAFHAIVALPEDRWAAELLSRCGSDPLLHEHVRALLDSHARSENFLSVSDVRALAGGAPDDSHDHDALAGGTRLGEYVIERSIGSGGMGFVYVARQDRPSRVVALKVIRPGLASAALMRRFEHEADMLGRLQHPGIAQIYEAGSAPLEGGSLQAYIALELVEGADIRTFCTMKNLPTLERLALVARVCDAVQHAHQRGVIHRDLKPANILVDASGQPKVLDFGVARATSADARVTTMRTSVGQLVGTLPYMSPEQVGGDPADIDVRSDVYALGVILYELLTGRLPHDTQKRSLPEAARVIREDTPRSVAGVDRRFRGDIDTIVSKALDKDRSRRYQSAAELGDDLRRHIAGEPILARQNSTIYVLRRHLRRYRLAVTLGAVAVVALGALALYAVQSERRQARLAIAESDARARAERESERLRRSVYVSAIGFAQAALASFDVEGIRRALDECPSDLRGWEWSYLHAQMDMSSRVWRLPEGATTQMSASADAATIAVGFSGEHAAVRLFDTRSEREVGVVLPSNAIGGFALSGDASVLVCADREGSIFRCASPDWTPHRIALDADPRARVATRGGGPGGPGPAVIALSGDGRLGVVRSSQDSEPLWTSVVDLSSERTRRRLPGWPAWAAFSHDGARVAVSTLDYRVVLADVRGNAEPRVINLNGAFVHALAFSPDGSSFAAACSDGQVALIDVETAHADSLPISANKVRSLAWSPDGASLACAGSEPVIRIIDVRSHRIGRTLHGHLSNIGMLAWTDRGLVSGAWDGSVRWWDDPQSTPRDAMDWGRPLALAIPSRDGRSIFAADESGHIVEVDPCSFRVRREIASVGPGYTQGMDQSPDGTLLAVGLKEGSVDVIDLRSGASCARFSAPSGRALDVEFGPDGTEIAVGSDAPCATIWDPRTGTKRRDMEMPSGATPTHAMRVAWSTSGSLLAASSGEDAVLIHDAHSGRINMALATPGEGRPWHLRFFNHDRSLCTSHDSGRVIVWDVSSGRRVREFVGHQSTVHNFVLSRDESRLFTGGRDNTVRVWDTETGQCYLTLRGHRLNVKSMGWSASDGTLWSASDEGQFRWWRVDAASGEAGESLRARGRPPAGE